ncbi:MAG: hypothetical protein KC731_08505 [Myxococcales bacterium]|nr:hypothetical protein [Myxococcales bacterium]
MQLRAMGWLLVMGGVVACGSSSVEDDGGEGPRLGLGRPVARGRGGGATTPKSSP